MAHGKSLELEQYDRQMSYRTLEPRETRERDRSLRGKKRVKVRKAYNRMRRQLGLD